MCTSSLCNKFLPFIQPHLIFFIHNIFWILSCIEISYKCFWLTHSQTVKVTFIVSCLLPYTIVKFRFFCVSVYLKIVCVIKNIYIHTRNYNCWENSESLKYVLLFSYDMQHDADVIYFFLGESFYADIYVMYLHQVVYVY